MICVLTCTKQPRLNQLLNWKNYLQQQGQQNSIVLEHILSFKHGLEIKFVTDWFWKQTAEGIIKPNITDDQLIPDHLLKTICCSCEKGCSSVKCGCRKHGLKCTNLCLNCFNLENFSNAELPQVSIDESDSEEMETNQCTVTETILNATVQNSEESFSFVESDEEEFKPSAKRARL